MTVKELKEKLEQFPDNYIVIVTADWETRKRNNWFPYAEATGVLKGVNELDGTVLIDDYVEDD
jgi:hypothetical protein